MWVHNGWGSAGLDLPEHLVRIHHHSIRQDELKKLSLPGITWISQLFQKNGSVVAKRHCTLSSLSFRFSHVLHSNRYPKTISSYRIAWTSRRPNSVHPSQLISLDPHWGHFESWGKNYGWMILTGFTLSSSQSYCGVSSPTYLSRNFESWKRGP